MEIALVIGGLLSIISAAMDWDWFMNYNNARLFVKMFGRNGARIFYVLFGLTLIIFAGLIFFDVINLS